MQKPQAGSLGIGSPTVTHASGRTTAPENSRAIDSSGLSPFCFNPLESPYLENPYPLYARARQEAPVFWSPLFSTWVVTRYGDVQAILRDPRRFSSSYLFRTPVDPPPEVLKVLAQIPPEVLLLVSEDPPGHTRTRALVSPAFLPRQVARMAARIRVIAHELIDQFLEAGCADLVRQYTYPLPMRVLLEFLGLPAEDADFIKQWCQDHMLLSVPGIGAAQQLRSAQTEVAFSRYTEALIAARQRQPQEDVLSALIHARVQDARPLDVVELNTLLQQLLFAGHETTTNLLSNTFCALLRDGTQWRALHRDLTLATQAVEEGLRYDAPVQGMFRTTTEDVTISGVMLPAGARIFVVFGAANRDERIFAEPDRFDLQRPNADKHVSFGHGIHYCIGAPFVRLEARIAIEVLVQRLPDLHLVSEQTLTYLPNLLNRALQHLQVCWEESGKTHGSRAK
jgi:cytochrome P450